MKKRMKIISAFLSAVLSLVPMLQVYAASAPPENFHSCVSIEHFSSEEDRRAAVKAQIAKELAAQGIESNIYFPDDPIPANDIDDYKTIVVDEQTFQAYGELAGQPSRGVRFNSPLGGTIYCVVDGGATVDVAVSVSDPAGIVSVSLSLGSVSTGVTAYGINVPGYIYCKATANHTYVVSGYIVYKNVWVDDFVGWQWQEFSRAITPMRTSTDFGYIEV